MKMGDLDEDLCDGCFAVHCPDEQGRAGWVRVDVGAGGPGEGAA